MHITAPALQSKGFLTFIFPFRVLSPLHVSLCPLKANSNTPSLPECLARIRFYLYCVFCSSNLAGGQSLHSDCACEVITSFCVSTLLKNVFKLLY